MNSLFWSIKGDDNLKKVTIIVKKVTINFAVFVFKRYRGGIYMK